MAKNKFLDLIGLSIFKNKIIELFSSHTSNNDIHVTSEEKENLNEAYSHSTSTHASNDAEKNIIVGIQKNGEDLTVEETTRKVDITVPTKISELENDSGFVTDAESNTTYEINTFTDFYGTNLNLIGSDGSESSVSLSAELINTDCHTLSDDEVAPVGGKNTVESELTKYANAIKNINSLIDIMKVADITTVRECDSTGSMAITETDLDNFTTPGDYAVVFTESSTFGVGWLVFVEVREVLYTTSNSSGYVQRISSIYPSSGDIWSRSYYAVDGWSEWQFISATATSYSTGSSSTAGLTKLYTTTGTNTDGTMTQSAITTALSGKATSSHTHAYVPTSKIVNNLLANTAGYVLDARQGKVLSDKITNHTHSNYWRSDKQQVTNYGALINKGCLTTYLLSGQGSHYQNTGLLVQATDSTNAAAMGFHNPGINAGTLFLSRNDGLLHFITHGGVRYSINMTQES